jgi:hypothetical protein
MQKYLSTITYSRIVNNILVVNSVSTVKTFKVKQTNAKKVLKSRNIHCEKVINIEVTPL